MKKFWLCSLVSVFFAGCTGIPEHNYIGMTKAEVAAHLEKHAFRSRWSRNQFDITVLQSKNCSYSFSKAQEVAENRSVMSADQWNCDFFPQRHWLGGWDGVLARWHCYTLDFKDEKVVRQQTHNGLQYGTRGNAGKSPFPSFPKNVHKVNENLYRSAQPDEDEFFSLHTFNGIRSVVNLRGTSDKDEINAVNRRW